MGFYDISFCTLEISLFSGMHASSNTCVIVLISDLVYVRYIFPLTAFNNFSASHFKQFDFDSLKCNYVSSPQN